MYLTTVTISLSMYETSFNFTGELKWMPGCKGCIFLASLLLDVEPSDRSC